MNARNVRSQLRRPGKMVPGGIKVVQRKANRSQRGENFGRRRRVTKGLQQQGACAGKSPMRYFSSAFSINGKTSRGTGPSSKSGFFCAAPSPGLEPSFIECTDSLYSLIRALSSQFFSDLLGVERWRSVKRTLLSVAAKPLINFARTRAAWFAGYRARQYSNDRRTQRSCAWHSPMPSPATARRRHSAMPDSAREAGFRLPRDDHSAHLRISAIVVRDRAVGQNRTEKPPPSIARKIDILQLIKPRRRPIAPVRHRCLHDAEPAVTYTRGSVWEYSTASAL